MPDLKMLSCAFVEICSIKTEVFQFILVGQFINCLKPYTEQASLYFLILGKKVLQ